MRDRTIQVVDLNSFINGNEEERRGFVDQLGRAFHEIGFVGVINHGIEKPLIDGFYQACKAFFSLPGPVKEKYEIAGMAGQRGYTSFGKEHAKHSRVADLKEFFQIGQEITDGDPIKDQYPDNISVEEIPSFLEQGIRLFKAFEQVGVRLLEAIALHLNLSEHFFASDVHNGNSILRAIYYPPLINPPDSAIRAEQHEDINLITLLVGASAGGLEILTKQGEWVPILPEDDEIVINVGDMLQRLTNDYLQSTTHRVVNPPKAEWHVPRLSIPFFLHPRKDMDLTCLDVCVNEQHPRKYETITAGDYLEERLKEIGLKE